MAPLPPSILIADQDHWTALGLSAILHLKGYTVCGVTLTARQTIATARRRRPDLIVMNLALTGWLDGVDAALAIHRERPTPIVFLADPKAEADARIAQDRPAAVVHKPYRAEALIAAIDTVLRPGPAR